jgi:hypothetical protein
MPTEKVSATLDREVLEEIRKTAGPRRVSSFLSEAAKEKLQRARILTYLDQLDAEHGPPDEGARRTASRRIRGVLE